MLLGGGGTVTHPIVPAYKVGDLVVLKLGWWTDMSVDTIETPIDCGIVLSIRIDNLRVFINKTLSIESLINQLLIKRVCLSISIDSR